MPDQGHVNGDHRLTELVLKCREYIDSAEVRADLNDSIDIVTVELVHHHIQDLRARRVSYAMGAVAFEAVQAFYVVTRFAEESPHPFLPVYETYSP